MKLIHSPIPSVKRQGFFKVIQTPPVKKSGMGSAFIDPRFGGMGNTDANGQPITLDVNGDPIPNYADGYPTTDIYGTPIPDPLSTLSPVVNAPASALITGSTVTNFLTNLLTPALTRLTPGAPAPSTAKATSTLSPMMLGGLGLAALVGLKMLTKKR
jgi:hypothetical protein